MQDRFMASIAGGLLGVVLDSFFSSLIDMSPVHTLLLFGFAGVALGYVVSMFVDVFTNSAASELE